MKLRYEKNIRLLTDLLGYCHMIGASEFFTHIALEDARSTIEVRCLIANLPQTRIDELNRHLNVPRQHEVEQYYWNISGEEQIDSELSLAGMMTDQADITYDGHELRITCVRLNEPNLYTDSR